MAVYSYHQEFGRWLDALSKGDEPGSEHTLSVEHPLCGGQFTTYKLGPCIGNDQHGCPLYDLTRDALAKMPDGQFITRDQINSAKAEMQKEWDYSKPITVAGTVYVRGVFGNLRLKRND